MGVVACFWNMVFICSRSAGVMFCPMLEPSMPSTTSSGLGVRVRARVRVILDPSMPSTT